MRNSPKFVKSYRAEFITPNGVEGRYKTDSLAELNKLIARDSEGSKMELENVPGSNVTQSIFIDNVWSGYVTQLDIPAHETVQARHEQRQQQQRKAA